MSYSNSFPTQTPSLNLNFATGSDQFLDSRISFSRADTPPTYAAPSAVHYWSNEKHLSSENLVTQSDASNWTFSSADYTKTASQSGPDGSTNATKFTEQANGSEQYQLQSNGFTPIANQEITYSVWLKQTSGSRNYQQLRVGNIGANQAFATFNLSNGTVDQTGGTLGVSASVNAGPTGWYQCVLRFTPTSTTALSFYIYAASASGGEIPYVTGDTGNSFTLFGAQASTLGETVVNETSGSIHREFAPTLKSVANAGDPRFEYSPADGQSNAGTALGLLIEAQSTSLVTYSEDSTQWSKAYSAFQINAGVSPDGTVTATLWTPDATANKHYMSNGMFSATSGTTYTGSVFLKGVNRTRAQLTFGAGGFAGGYVNFSLTGDGSVLTEQAGATGTISSCGNGWYRVTITDTADATTSTTGVTVGLISSDTEARLQTSTLNGYDSLLVTGFQIETGSHASSYIKSNSGSSTSRASDSCAVVDATLFSSGEHTIIWEGDLNATTVDARMAQISDGSYDNRIRLDFDDGARLRLVCESDGVSQVNASYTTDLSVGPHKVAATVKTNEAQLILDGTRRQVDTSGTVPAGLNELAIMKTFNASSSVHDATGHCKRITYYNVALSQAEAEALTSNP